MSVPDALGQMQVGSPTAAVFGGIGDGVSPIRLAKRELLTCSTELYPVLEGRMRKSGPEDIARLVRTVRHMRVRQVVNRIIRRVRRLPPTDGVAPALRQPRDLWRNCAGRLPSMLSSQRFRFVGREGELKTPSDWNGPEMPKLWLYNLHYFDDLRADGAISRSAWQRDLIAKWIQENPPTAGNGWEPYPASLRIVNWIAWALAGNDLGPIARQSLAAQVRVLGATLKYHLLGNHLLANAKALVFAGCFFSGNEADDWRQTGLDLLDAEFAEQILEIKKQDR